MYEELVKSLRCCAAYNDDLCNDCKYHNMYVDLCYDEIKSDAADAIDKLVIICNSLLSKYEEEAEAMIYEYSGHINEDLDKLRKEIEDYKAQINGVAEQPKEE